MKNEWLLKHKVRWAKHKNTAPTIFLIHGYGSNEDDLLSLAMNLSPDYNLISLRAPYPLSDSGFAWYAIDLSQEKEKWCDNQQGILSRNLIASFIDQCCELYQLNKSDFTLLGFSQGAILSYAVALCFAQKVRRVVALSGYIHKEFLNDDLKTQNFNNLNIYSSHGVFDQIVPYEWAKKTPILLNELNIQNLFEEFAAGHSVCAQNFQSLAHWLAVTD